MDKRGSELVHLVHPGSQLYGTSPVGFGLYNGLYNGYIRVIVCYCTSQILGAHMQAAVVSFGN